ncbi:MAG: ATP-binding cassette domain-containing protein [Atopobiaceae bacterium]|nr:ATP-binding cassette domain-containing protein [Atopobiaceae bacterium]
MLEARGVGYRYKGSSAKVLSDVSVSVSCGEYVAVVGRNGGGKSTLAGVMAGILEPCQGEVLVDGHDLATRWADVGLVRQDPRAQLVSDVVFDEVAFGPQNMGLSQDEIRRRVENALNDCGLSYAMGAQTSELSGGEQQRLVLAGILAVDPTYLVLDEVMSQLDMRLRAEFGRTFASLCKQGKGILAITHQVEEVLAAQRVVLLENGIVRWQGTPLELMRNDDLLASAGLVATPFLDVAKALACSGVDITSTSFDDAYAVAAKLKEAHCQELLAREKQQRGERFATALPQMSSLTLEGIEVWRGDVHALRGLTCAALAGSVTLVAGASGSGKSTAALVAAGAIAASSGSVRLESRDVRLGDVGLCQQSPEDQLFCSTVRDDVAYGSLSSGLSEKEAFRRAETALEELGVSKEYWSRSPFALSIGERRRVAVAGIVASDQRALVLDEPTAGMDDEGCALLVEVVRRLAQEGRAVLVVSHDVDLWLGVADQVVLIREGRSCYAGPVEEAAEDEHAFLDAMGMSPFSVSVRAALHEGDGHVTSQPRIMTPPSRSARSGIAFSMPAGLKVVLVLAVTVLLFVGDGWLPLVGLLALSLLYCAVAQEKVKDVLVLMRRISIVLAMMWLVNSIVLDGTGDITLVGRVTLSLRGMERGAYAILRIVTLTLFVAATARCTTSNEVAKALLAPLRVLEPLGMSFEELKVTVTLALRAIPMAIDSFLTVQVAQQARGGRLGVGGLKERLSSWVAVLVPMIVVLMHRADELGEALWGRGLGRKTND